MRAEPLENAIRITKLVNYRKEKQETFGLIYSFI